MSLISIIVPVYNAESTIGRCAGSILSQTYRRLQLILVDDGSTDSSGSVIDMLAKKDSRVFAVHTKNRGASSARNAGLEAAKGDYIGFADADDWADAGMYGHLLSLIESEGADIAVCGYYAENTSQISSVPAHGQKAMSGSEAYAEAFKGGFGGYLFNKLFRSDFFSREGRLVRLDEKLHICEDLLFVLRCLCLAESVVFDPEPFYHYTVSAHGASGGPFSERKATLIEARRKIADLTAAFRPDLWRTAENDYISAAVYIFILSLHSRCDFRLPEHDLNRIRKHAAAYLFGKNHVKYKVLLPFLCLSPQAVKAVFKLFRARKQP